MWITFNWITLKKQDFLDVYWLVEFLVEDNSVSNNRASSMFFLLQLQTEYILNVNSMCLDMKFQSNDSIYLVSPTLARVIPWLSSTLRKNKQTNTTKPISTLMVSDITAWCHFLTSIDTSRQLFLLYISQV